MNNWNRLTPVSLTREYPVTELIINLCITNSLFCKEFNHLFLSFFNFKSINEIRIDKHTCCYICKCCLININFFTILGYNLNNRQIKLLGKLPVSFIMCRNSHDSTCTIAHKYIVRYPDWNFLAINRINCLKSVNLYTCLILRKLCSLEI